MKYAPLLLIILCAGCVQQSCEKLKTSFDSNINSFGVAECEEVQGPVWVGGTLLSTSTIYSTAYERYEHTLTLQGLEEQGIIIILSSQETLPYQIGNFYKFDLKGKCALIQSSSSSEAFTGELIETTCS